MYKERIKDILIGERIVLRKFRKEDNQAVYEYGSDEETMKYLAWQGVQSIEEANQSIATYYMVTPGVYAIALKDTDVCIGAIDIRLIEEHDKAHFGYVLNRNYWKHGYMSEALSLVLEHCFKDIGLQRVESTHYKENIGSGRVMQKCGMQYEGLGRREVKIKGKYQDVVYYGILKEDFLVFHKVMK
jgi:ribosomal-protein-alanine N-acetyltransferase